jgi:hypothetical protein
MGPGKPHLHCIYTAFVGEGILPGITNGNPYSHYSLLWMVEDNYGI